MEPLASGDTFGGGVAYWLTGSWSVGAQADYLKAEAEIYPYKGYHYRDNFSAMEIGGFVRFAGWFNRELLGMVGVGAGRLTLSGAYHEYTTPYGASQFDLSAGCLSTQVFGEIDYFLADFAALGLNVGYRLAKVDEVRGQGAGYDGVVYFYDGAQVKLDYSGVFCVAVLKFFIN